MEQDSKVWAFLSVFLSVLGVVLAYLLKKDDSYVMHYAKQSLVLVVAWVILWVLNFVLVFIPFVGRFVFWILWLGLVVLWVMGWVYALSGEKKEIPVLGSFASKF